MKIFKALLITITTFALAACGATDQKSGSTNAPNSHHLKPVKARIEVAGQPSKVLIRYKWIDQDSNPREVSKKVVFAETKSVSFTFKARRNSKISLSATPLSGEGWLDCRATAGSKKSDNSSGREDGCFVEIYTD